MDDENKKNEPNVQADDNSVAVGGITVGGDLSGKVNIAAGHIVNAEEGSIVIIGTPAEAVSGLGALRDLMQRSSVVRTAVITFQTDFRVAHEQVDRLGDYKDLHDLLHRLQFHCYNGIAQAEASFPDNQLTIDNLLDYHLTLESIIEELKQTATRPSMPQHELGWIDELGLAKADLFHAIDLLDKKFLKKVIWRLNHILSTRPARINILLNHSARALRLPVLLSALMIVRETLASLDLDANKVAKFQAGVDALGELDKNLSSLVEDHDNWQSLDGELRLSEATLDDLNTFQMSWSDIRLRAEPLYIACSDEWANVLKQNCSVLEDALNANHPGNIRRSFRNYHRRVSERFFRVDFNLKTLCGEMRKIGIPLASVLDLVQ